MTGTNTQTSGPGSQWFVVDFDRIMRLPERLRQLWPRELLPGELISRSSGLQETRSRETGSSIKSGRGLDVLSAWLTGFAAELNLTQSRMAIVISSGTETVHLEVGVCEGTCLAVLVLRGKGFAEFEGFELLRRIRPPELAQAVEDLGHLVEEDCVLTLSHVSTGGDSGLDFLHRTGGNWSRPTLQRCESGITVGTETDAGTAAVRTLVAATLTRLCAMGPREGTGRFGASG